MTRVLLIAAAAAAFSTQVQAQDAPQMAPRAERGGRDVTRSQTQQMADMMFQRIDLNHDGVLTRQEAEQARTQMGAGGEDRCGGRAERKIARLFGDQQSVTLAQAEAEALARFDAEDLNHDGVVTSDERRSFREQRGLSKPNYTNVLPPPPATPEAAQPPSR
jgi:hypothetical protein